MQTVYLRIIPLLLAITLFFGILSQGVLAEEPGTESESAAPDNPLAQSDSLPRNPSASELAIMLENESLDQTLFRLKNVNLFFSPGPTEPGEIVWAGTPAFPLSDKDEFFSVRVVMGNRRVSKLHEELAALPGKEAADHVNKQITALLPEYTRMYTEDKEINSTEHFTIAGIEREEALGGGSIFGVGYVTNTIHPNDVTLAGLRYAVLSLVWVAGALELEGVHDSIVMVAEEGIRQRDKVYEDKIHHDAHRESVIKYLSLYNRTILGNALLGTSPRLREQFEQNQGKDLEKRTITRRRFNDLHERFELGASLPAENDVSIEYRTGFTDPMIDDLLSQSKEVVR